MPQQVVAKFAGNKPALKSWVLLIGAWLTIGLAVVANGRRRVSFDSGDIGSDSEMSYGYNPWEQPRRPYVICSPQDYEWCCESETNRRNDDAGKSIDIAECLIKYVKNSYVGYNMMPRECCSISELSGACRGQGNGYYQSLNAIKKRSSTQVSVRAYNHRSTCPAWKKEECCGEIYPRRRSYGLAYRQGNLFQTIIQCLAEIIQSFATVQRPDMKLPPVCCKIPILSGFCSKQAPAF